MDISNIEILVEMQKTEPTGTEKRSCRKVSFAAPALHKQCYLTFNASQNNFVFAKIFSFLLLIWDFFLFWSRVKAFNTIPYYREKVSDPDPERCYTKAKVEKLKTLNIETVQTELIDQQASSCSSILDTFPPHQNTQFSEDVSVLPPFVPMDAFEQVKTSGKSMKKFTNAAIVINSNGKGLRVVNFVHDLQVYNNGKITSYTSVLAVGPPIRGMLNTRWKWFVKKAGPQRF